MSKKLYIFCFIIICIISLHSMPNLKLNMISKFSKVLSTELNSSIEKSVFGDTVCSTPGKMKAGVPQPMCTEFLTNPERSEQACMLETLNNTLPLLKTVLIGKSLAFLGDSRMRDMFAYLRSLLSGAPFRAKQFYENVVYHHRETNTTLEFYWCRFPDEGGQIVAQWKYGFRIPPQYALLGFGAWSVDKYGGSSIEDFVAKAEHTSKLLHAIRSTTTAIWMQTIPVNPNVTFDNWTQHDWNSEHVEAFGRRLTTTAAKYELIVWNTAHDIAKQRLDLFRDHVHPGTALTQVFACQLLHAIQGTECHNTMKTRCIRTPSKNHSV